MKKVLILYSTYTPIIDSIKFALSNVDVSLSTDCSFDDSDYDLVILSNYEEKYEGEALCSHHSLLPAFDGKNPAMEAILSGVKVTGMTIYYKKKKKIVAQYPVFIKNSVHFDELEKELTYIEQTIFPIVISKILNNEQFELQTLINNCGQKCGGCGQCSH